MSDRPPSRNVGQGIALGAVAGQAGCLIVVMVLAGLGVGIWLDGQLGTRPLFTLALVLLSIPLSLAYAVGSILRLSRAIHGSADQQPAPESQPEKERRS